MPELILITGNAGQGKTIVAVNLAVALAQYGYDVLLFDADLKTPKINYQFGKTLPKKTIQDVLRGKINVEEAVYVHSTNLKILFSSPAQPISDHPIRLLDKIQKLAQIIIIDVPTNDFQWYRQKIKTFLVTNSDFPSVLEAIKLSKNVVKSEGIIINNVKNEIQELTPKNISVLTNKKIVGVLKEEKKIRESHKLGHPLVEINPDLCVAVTLKTMAANLMNQQYITPLK